MSEFFNMGGYAVYVWSAYALTLDVLVINLIIPVRNEKQLIKNLRKRQQREDNRK